MFCFWFVDDVCPESCCKRFRELLQCMWGGLIAFKMWSLSTSPTVPGDVCHNPHKWLHTNSGQSVLGSGGKRSAKRIVRIVYIRWTYHTAIFRPSGFFYMILTMVPGQSTLIWFIYHTHTIHGTCIFTYSIWTVDFYGILVCKCTIHDAMG